MVNYPICDRAHVWFYLLALLAFGLTYEISGHSWIAGLLAFGVVLGLLDFAKWRFDLFVEKIGSPHGT